MDWKYLQNPAFQVLYPVISCNERPPPLQIRAFTSDSYQAIKERERKKSGRREQNNTEQRSSVWEGEIGASASAVPMQEVTRMDSRPHDVVSLTHSEGLGTELLVIQNGGKTQEDNGRQNRLSSPGAVPASPLDDPSGGETPCLAAPTSPVISPKACGSDPKVHSSVEHEWEMTYSRVPDPPTASLDDGLLITTGGDDAGAFDQQPHIRARNNTGLAVDSSSHPMIADSSAGGCSNPFEQLSESRDTHSPSLVSLELDSAPVVAAATGFDWNSSTLIVDGALAKAMPDDTGHTVGVAGAFRSLIHRARSERAGWKDCISTSQSAWTSRQDEQLLHLRNTAQLNWKNIVDYFPEMPLDAVKGRYKHLHQCRTIYQTESEVPEPRVQTRKGATYLTSSTPKKAEKNLRAQWRTKSRKQPINILSEHYNTPPRRHMTIWAKPTKYVPSLVVAADKDAYPRTSRCGRPIRHPFRHRPADGYV